METLLTKEAFDITSRMLANYIVCEYINTQLVHTYIHVVLVYAQPLKKNLIMVTSSVPLQAIHRHQGQGDWLAHQGGVGWVVQTGLGQGRYAFANLQRNLYTSSAASH